MWISSVVEKLIKRHYGYSRDAYALEICRRLCETSEIKDTGAERGEHVAVSR